MYIDKYISVAPMMDWTDRHCRYFMRLLNPDIRLFTEMIVVEALLHGDHRKLLNYDQSEHPVALQLGGNDPEKMKKAATIGVKAGFDEININVGCPSDRVKSGSFGACLMAKPKLIGNCIQSIKSAIDSPVSVKTRIGIDDLDNYEFLRNFVSIVSESGCTTFIIHARKAILTGLSPKKNLSVPPLNYDRVYQLKSEFDHLNIILNGGLNSIEDCLKHLKSLDGIMIGRHAYRNPWFLKDIYNMMLNNQNLEMSRQDVVEKMYPYIESQLSKGVKLNHITRHMLGLFSSQPRAKLWRSYISEHSKKEKAGIEVLENAFKKIAVSI
ncbi:MAG: tRNA dihydrouridine(20/20a) synthase DusA [Woeseiaceae bacterium]|nr:tRNA dihydrouridine(20/20a) synthase DusA [Woeseiaceae bacterium]